MADKLTAFPARTREVIHQGKLAMDRSNFKRLEALIASYSPK
jgi:hypothetical protein